MSQLLVVGASVRAAVCSARRANWSPRALDQFGDADLTRLAPAQIVRRYPSELLRLIRSEPVVPWIYTGGLENYPRLLAALAASRRLWGNGAEVVRRVRNPRRLAAALASAGFCMPPMHDRSDEVPCDGSWLVKRRRSAGGLGVRRWTAANTTLRFAHGWYWQRFVEGEPLGATFVAGRRAVRFLGATRTLVATDNPDRPWLYGGSSGPAPLTSRQQQRFEQLGECLARAFGLSGLFGVDTIVTDDTLWVLEVNPRYTASVEVLELATGINALELHRAACLDEPWPDVEPHGGQVVGKQIIYARRSWTIDAQQTTTWLAQNHDPLRPILADVPQPGTVVEPGQPLATVLVYGATLDEVQQQLPRVAAQLEQLDCSRLPT